MFVSHTGKKGIFVEGYIVQEIEARFGAELQERVNTGWIACQVLARIQCCMWRNFDPSYRALCGPSIPQINPRFANFWDTIVHAKGEGSVEVYYSI
jgi:hypothetical protein